MDEPIRNLHSRLDELERDRTIKHVENVTKLTRIETSLDLALTRLFGDDSESGIIGNHNSRISKLEKVVYVITGAVGLVELLHTLRDFKLFG